MGGVLDWAALPVLAEMLGIEDVEKTILQLAAIREWQMENRD